MRIQFKESHTDPRLFKEECPRNELVMKVSPHEAIYFKFNMKQPGLSQGVTTTELDLSYNHRYEEIYRPLAYTRLILSGVRGEQESFVRDDELIRAWEIFSPLLDKIENGKKEAWLFDIDDDYGLVFFLFNRCTQLQSLLTMFEHQTHQMSALLSSSQEVLKYPFGSRGPAAADEILAKFNFVWNKSYAWKAR